MDRGYPQPARTIAPLVRRRTLGADATALSCNLGARRAHGKHVATGLPDARRSGRAARLLSSASKKPPLGRPSVASRETSVGASGAPTCASSSSVRFADARGRVKRGDDSGVAGDADLLALVPVSLF
jgi:hypothetical protein